jgi:hypothetical protein
MLKHNQRENANSVSRPDVVEVEGVDEIEVIPNKSLYWQGSRGTGNTNFFLLKQFILNPAPTRTNLPDVTAILVNDRLQHQIFKC